VERNALELLGIESRRTVPGPDTRVIQSDD
jgi:hypothetical protein